MIAALALYGSRARGDSRVSSDVDLLGITQDGQASTKRDYGTVNLHTYSLEWLLKEARKGGLFLLHIAFEAVPIYDPLTLLKQISSSFIYKASYSEEIETCMRILRTVQALPAEKFTQLVRQRYYWALRTLITALAAERREVRFGADDLQAFSSIHGVAEHIRHRELSSFGDCKKFASKLLEFVNKDFGARGWSDSLATLSDMEDITAFRAKVSTEQFYIRAKNTP